ncbi:hypothetical protein JCM14469_09940 [Desulfatiferula olefinivorans]
MLNQFIDDVISKGADAVLPQNLDQTWLDLIYVAAKNFLTIAVTAGGEIDEDQVLSDANSMMMLSSIVEIAQEQSGYQPSDQPFDIPEDLMFEYISCYAMAVILESVDRESDLGLDKPTVSNIFDRDRLFAIEESCPEVTALLNNLIG